MTASACVALAAGPLIARIEGGSHLSVSSLRLAGEELLVDPSELPPGYRVHGRRAGITLLHPWANRLPCDDMSVDGRRLVVAVDDPLAGRDDHGRPIHGLANPVGWELEAVSEREAHAAARWPSLRAFPFEHAVEVRLEVADERTLRVTTTVAALEPAGVPISFGWHPYFAAARSEGVSLCLPGRGELPLAGRAWDDGIDGLSDGDVLGVSTPRERIEVRLEEGYPQAQVFAPLDAAVVSLEPMTAPTGALASGRGLRIARLGEPFSARFSVTISEVRRGGG